MHDMSIHDMGMYDVTVHNVVVHDMVVHDVVVHDTAMLGIGVNRMWNFLVVKKIIFDAHFMGKTPMFSY